MSVIPFFLTSLGAMVAGLAIENWGVPWLRDKFSKYRLIKSKYTFKLFDIAPDYSHAQYRNNGDYLIEDVLKYDENAINNLCELTTGLDKEAEDGYTS